MNRGTEGMHDGDWLLGGQQPLKQDEYGGFLVPAECVPILEESFRTGKSIPGPTLNIPIPPNCDSVTFNGVEIWRKP